MRLLTSKTLHVTRNDLKAMSYDEYSELHATLDALEAAELDAIDQAKADAASAQRGGRR